VIENEDTLILYSDGISEASNQEDHEFGEIRIKEIVSGKSNDCPAKVCEQIINEVSAFAGAETPADDCTLLVVYFPQPQIATTYCAPTKFAIAAAWARQMKEKEA